MSHILMKMHLILTEEIKKQQNVLYFKKKADYLHTVIKEFLFLHI